MNCLFRCGKAMFPQYHGGGDLETELLPPKADPPRADPQIRSTGGWCTSYWNTYIFVSSRMHNNHIKYSTCVQILVFFECTFNCPTSQDKSKFYWGLAGYGMSGLNYLKTVTLSDVVFVYQYFKRYLAKINEFYKAFGQIKPDIFSY